MYRMKTQFSLTTLLLALVLLPSCARKNYKASFFEEQTRDHKIIAILPPEMIFTGTHPKELTAEDIKRIEEDESSLFQTSLFNGILRHANTSRYYTEVAVQDISTTLGLLEKNNISIRGSWREDDRKLADILGVDAVVRMRVQKKRYMSDLASLGIDLGQQVLSQLGNGNFPYISNKTNDIYASCNVVSNGQTLWNDHYKRSTSYNAPAEDVIYDITENFGKRFPYRKKR